MPSLRQYVTPTEIAEILNGLIDVDLINNDILNQAESLVDKYVGTFIVGQLAPLNKKTFFTNAVFTNTTAILDGSFSGQYNFCCVRPLGGSFVSKLIPILSHTNQTITFNSIAGLSGNMPCIVEQIGKFPIRKDSIVENNTRFSWIPFEVKQAVAYQVQFMIENAEIFVNQNLKSESIGSSYSYTKSGAGDNQDITKYIAPQAINILKGYNFYGV